MISSCSFIYFQLIICVFFQTTWLNWLKGPALPVAKIKFFLNVETKKIPIFLAYITPRPPMNVKKKKFIPIGPAIWPAIHHLYVLFYYIDIVMVLFYF